MKGKNAVLVALSLLMLTGMRDPFRQPEDHCHGAELAQWQYQDGEQGRAKYWTASGRAASLAACRAT